MSANIGMGNIQYRWDSQVTSPFQSLTRRVYPRNMREVLAWAEELWLHHGVYSEALKKAVRYFLTEVEISGDGVDYRMREKYSSKIVESEMLQTLQLIGDDYVAFGNSFTSVHFPFMRVVVCPMCGARHPVEMMMEENIVRWSEFSFVGTCPAIDCGFKGTFNHEDSTLPDKNKKPTVIRWAPQFMELENNLITGTTRYKVDLSEMDDLQTGLRNGDPLYVAETPWEIIEAVKENRKLVFNKDKLFHLHSQGMASSIPGLKGWGLPAFMSEFENAVMIMLLDKYNEAIVTDYLMPFRLLSPKAGALTEEGDNMLNLNMGTWKSTFTRLINEHRRNPTGWNFLPFPAEYQVIGGEATDLAPVELLEFYENRLLSAIGVPHEFVQNSLAGNAAPLIGFKIFERTWSHLPAQLNTWLTWYASKHSEIMNWEPVDVSLVPVSVYEDPERRMAVLDLAAAGKVSERTSMRLLDLDPVAEFKQIQDEQDEMQEIMSERAAKMENKDINMQATRMPPAGLSLLEQQQGMDPAMGGGMPSMGGAPAPMGGGMPPMGGGAPAAGPDSSTIDDLLMQADTMAQQLLTADPLSRRQQLTSLKHQNEALHAQVKSRLNDYEQMAQTTGVQMMRSGQIPVTPM